MGSMASTQSVSLYKEDLGANPPAGSRGRAPGERVRGQSYQKLKAF